MRSIRTARVLTAAALLLGIAGVSAANAHATTSADTTSTVTLPLFGAPLTVDVTTGPGGALTSVAVNPSDGFTAVVDRPNKVVFTNEAGTAKVAVGNHHGSQTVAARAGSLADISGPGGWSGDVFGTGTATTVSFTIGATADGGPDITGVSSSDATAVIGATEYRTHDDHDGESSKSASAKVTFNQPGLTRTLTIKVKVSTEEDGTVRASSSVTLGRLRGAALPAEQVIGDHVWTGALCNGDPISIAYTVDADGKVTLGLITPVPSRTNGKGHRTFIAFSEKERVVIQVKVDGTQMTVDVTTRLHCDAAAPEVNTPVSTTAPGGDHHSGDHHKGDHHNGDHHNGDHHGGSKG